MQFASFSFDISVEEVFSCLTRGATLVLREDEMTASTASLLRACREQRLTVLNLPTAYWHQLSASLTAADWSQADTVRLVIIGSEKLQPERLSQWHAVVGQQVRLVDVYGPTEATIGSTMCDLTGLAGVGCTYRKISIGRPLRHAQAYILDARLEPVPIGVAGELHIGGLGLSQGYLNHPKLTAEKFIPHPFSAVAGARLYRTGDLARFLPDGNIEFLGRLDEQVKVRGFRIEPGEIERALAQHTRVRDAVVILKEDGSEKRLIAYLVADTSNAPTMHDLRRHLKERLPEYMLPSAFIFIDSLPLTPSGKVDTRALPQPDHARPELVNIFVAPQTELEQLLAHIWADVLKLERVGLGDNFFELGGDSILTIQVVARAQAAGLKLTAREMFKHPTVAELAVVASALPMAQADEGAITGEVPLTPIQRWFFAQEFEAADHWNMAVLLEARGQLQADLLEQALSQLLVHHDALRLRFVREAAGWRAFIEEYRDDQFQLRTVDLSEMAEEKQQKTIEAIAGETQAQLSLMEGPLLRAVLFELGEGRAPRLLVVVHHLVIDGVSWSILLDDLASLYRQLQGGESRELSSKTTSFKTWAEHLEKHARSADAPDASAYWTTLATREFKSLPVDYPGGTNLEASTRTISVALSTDETRSLLQEVPAVYHTQINDVLLTALVAAFEHWTGESELLLELESHGREELFPGVNLSRTVGWFTSAFPVLLQLDDPVTPGKALRSIKEQLRAIPDNGINYGLLRYMDAQPELAATLRSLPQPGVSFNYLGQVDRMLESASIFGLARTSVGPTRDGRNRRTHLLEVNAGIFDGELRLDWSYSSELHNDTTIERLAKTFAQALRGIIEHCLSPGAGGYTPSDFPLAKLDQQRLDELLKTVGPVADIYTLSPMQQGMLFYSLYAPEAGMYIEQLSCALDGELNVALFSQAWQQVAARHAILRTAFIWENLDEPLQVVRRDVSLTLAQYDWSKFAPAEQERLLESFISEDRLRAFELSRAPLMRLALLRMASDSYRFIWTHHHLLLDGWSVALLLREVLIAYEALCRGEELPSRSALRPFRDYIAWLQKQDISKAELFWRAELKGFTGRTLLTAGWPATSAEKVRQKVSKQEARLTPEETASLQAFARRSRLTLSTLVHGAFALLLSRYSLEDDVVFGTTVSGRPPALFGVDSIAGLFINTLPVRVQVQPQTSALNWLRSLQDKLVSLRDYEYSSLVDVQGWSDVPREQALFESLLVFENYPVDAALFRQTHHLKLSDMRSFERTNYPLTIAALPGTELLLQALYADDRFDDATIERLLRHLKNLLLDITTNPDKSLADVRLLSEDERRRMVEEWNSTDSLYPQEKSLHQLFEEQVELTPERVALVFDSSRLTYSELNQRANRLAHHLLALGVGAEVTVGFMLERSVEMVVAILAILKAGGAYVPLDPSYPPTRLDFMLSDAQLSVVITESALVDKLPSFSGRVICIDADAQLFAEASKENPVSYVIGENIAYVNYTSGSTGEPKGISIPHRAVTRLVRNTNYIEVESSDRIAQASNASFDAITFELWGALLNGAQLVIMSKDLVLSPEDFATQIRRNEISILFLTTALFNQLANSAPEAFSTVRQVLFGGEAVEPKWVKKVMDEGAPARLQHLYGPTESTTYATWYEVREVCEDGGTVPIGRPVSNTQVYLLDSRLEPVAVGVAGELYIGGDGLARGYLRHPELTAERFIPHPFSQKAGSRLYRTGDLARYRPNGDIEFLGRIDYQVKVRGFRIEPGEIEAVLSAHEMVGAVAVLAREDKPGERRLVAYVVAADEERSVTASELRSYLRERLPEYMVPSAFVLMERLPLTPNGKVDRRALPAPARVEPQSGAQFVAPRNPIEEALADIWRRLLGVDRIGVHDNFFELGGHSLMATRVLSNVRRIFRMELPLRVIFESNTIADLALAIIPFETQPGQTEKIARVLQKVKGISAEEVSKELEKKRRERNSR
ncbi:MAG TPA: amino acid adenylation domain-containing protein [Pyrinomonadaceae bacterium]|nr:amino acid adenylation domain-containing protein [Pyrinomonadaceae bacterium]